MYFYQIFLFVNWRYDPNNALNIVLGGLLRWAAVHENSQRAFWEVGTHKSAQRSQASLVGCQFAVSPVWTLNAWTVIVNDRFLISHFKWNGCFYCDVPLLHNTAILSQIANSQRTWRGSGCQGPVSEFTSGPSQVSPCSKRNLPRDWMAWTMSANPLPVACISAVIPWRSLLSTSVALHPMSAS